MCNKTIDELNRERVFYNNTLQFLQGGLFFGKYGVNIGECIDFICGKISHVEEEIKYAKGYVSESDAESNGK